MRSQRVLIVDDDEDMLDCLEVALGERFSVTLASGGEEALRYLRHQPFDVVVLDLMMPRVDGFGVMRELGARGTKQQVIVASALPDLPQIAEQCGATAWISKPYRLDTLERTIDQALERIDESAPEREPAAAPQADRSPS